MATDLTVTILGEIRDEIRELRGDVKDVRGELASGLVNVRAEQQEFRHEALARFEVIESTIRDLAPQLVILSRAI